MKAARSICSVAAAVTAVLAAAAARADTASDASQSNPVSIERCMAAQQPMTENPKIGFRPSHVSGITVVYTIDHATPATQVRFRIRYGGLTLSLVDRGTLPPGKKISREFSSFDAIYSGDSADCSATSVTFADGTAWNATGSKP